MKIYQVYKWLAPMLLALLLFVCIRVVSDLPERVSYWEGNSLKFIFNEVISIIVVGYMAYALLRIWLRLNRRRRNLWIEYGGLILGTLLICLATMFVSWQLNDRMFTVYDVVIPAVVAELFILLAYAFLRNQISEKENEAQRLQLEKIKNDQLQTELKFLKAQYHPHFLFNVLNTVYFQIDEKNEAPRRTLEQLSELLRYQLYNDGEKVRVRVEADYLKQYISLCKLRTTKRLQLQVHFDEIPEECEIYPLLFVPLVENAFKYVGGEYFITIELRLKDDGLHFLVENSVPESVMQPKKKQGIGIENLKRRLELLYPGRYTLDINKGEALFTVKLMIKL
ncbi:sensor histidine kinase [Bacteroides sp.]|uniref:sensor histidine kinase n=1 Tax=Bacteroides sp. TaxID=29523 RepID=UPI003AB49935